VSAIMNTYADNLDQLTDDDIAGVRALYEPAERGEGRGAETTALPPVRRGDGRSLPATGLPIERTRR